MSFPLAIRTRSTSWYLHTVPASTILCPTCKGQVGKVRGKTLEQSLDNHVRLTHTVVRLKPNPAPDPFEIPAAPPKKVPSKVPPKRATASPAALSAPKRRPAARSVAVSARRPGRVV